MDGLREDLDEVPDVGGVSSSHGRLTGVTLLRSRVARLLLAWISLRLVVALLGLAVTVLRRLAVTLLRSTVPVRSSLSIRSLLRLLTVPLRLMLLISTGCRLPVWRSQWRSTGRGRGPTHGIGGRRGVAVQRTLRALDGGC